MNSSSQQLDNCDMGELRKVDPYSTIFIVLYVPGGIFGLIGNVLLFLCLILPRRPRRIPQQTNITATSGGVNTSNVPSGTYRSDRRTSNFLTWVLTCVDLALCAHLLVDCGLGASGLYEIHHNGHLAYLIITSVRNMLLSEEFAILYLTSMDRLVAVVWPTSPRADIWTPKLLVVSLSLMGVVILINNVIYFAVTECPLRGLIYHVHIILNVSGGLLFTVLVAANYTILFTSYFRRMRDQHLRVHQQQQQQQQQTTVLSNRVSFFRILFGKHSTSMNRETHESTRSSSCEVHSTVRMAKVLLFLTGVFVASLVPTMLKYMGLVPDIHEVLYKAVYLNALTDAYIRFVTSSHLRQCLRERFCLRHVT